MDLEAMVELGLVRKRAQTAAERERLGREATMLRAVAHPGVVQLLEVEGGDPPHGLVLRRVGGTNLLDLGAQPAAVVAGLGAALATTIADLHDVGVTHGAIEAEHVLLDADGRPVLCSFGQATLALPTAQAVMQRCEDVRSLARLLLERLPAGSPRRAVRTLRQAAGPGQQSRCRSARWVARQLVATIPAARLPDLRDPTGHEPVERTRSSVARESHATASRSSRRPQRPSSRLQWRWAVVVSLCLVGAVAVSFATRWSKAPRRPRFPVSAPASAVTSLLSCPIVDDGCEPVPTPGGILTTPSGSFQLSSAGDVVVVGRWRCAPKALPAVLRPASGQVWTFAAWPTAARSETGHLVAQIGSARSLEVHPQPSGCDLLEVERRGLPEVTIDPVHP